MHGAKLKNPPSIQDNFIIITAPHAHCTSHLKALHDCDIVANKVTTQLFDELSKSGYNVVALINERSRQEIDMNRREGRNTEYRKALSNLMAKRPGLILDIHSYPNEKCKDGFQKYDIVLYDIPNLTNKNLLSRLNKNLIKQKAKVKVHKHNTINDIVTEAYLNGIPAVLIEHNEKFKGKERSIAVKLAKSIK